MDRAGLVRKLLGSGGGVLWEGPSARDGAPLVVVATSIAERYEEANSKTGDMVQTWILRADELPSEARRARRDESVCGGCRHRGAWGKRTCYVHMGHVDNVWRAWKRGRYPVLPDSPVVYALLFAGRGLRLGSYGDPAFVPRGEWEGAVGACESRTGYTHDWRDCDPGYRGLLMASADTPAEATEARAAGWRPFRVRRPWEPVLGGEVVCPATEEGGFRSTCDECRLCDGVRGEEDLRAGPTVVFHGPSRIRAGWASRLVELGRSRV